RQARPVEVEEGREGLVDVPIEEEIDLPLGKDGELDQPDLHLVDRRGDDVAMEVAAVQERAPGDVDHRIVGGGIELGGDVVAELADDVDDRAEDLGNATERVDLLDLLGCDVAVLDHSDARLQLVAMAQEARFAEKLAEACGDVALAGVWAGSMQLGGK